MRASASILSLVAVAALTVACNKPESQLVGKWQMDTSSSTQSNNPQEQALAKSLGGLTTLEFKSDKTFIVTVMGIATEGTYEMNGRNVLMKSTKVMGQDISKMPNSQQNQPQSLTLSDDGKTLSSVSGSRPIKFVKAAS